MTEKALKRAVLQTKEEKTAALLRKTSYIGIAILGAIGVYSGFNAIGFWIVCAQQDFAQLVVLADIGINSLQEAAQTRDFLTGVVFVSGILFAVIAARARLAWKQNARLRKRGGARDDCDKL